jgi:hypothetical protein
MLLPLLHILPQFPIQFYGLHSSHLTKIHTLQLVDLPCTFNSPTLATHDTTRKRPLNKMYPQKLGILLFLLPSPCQCCLPVGSAMFVIVINVACALALELTLSDP